MIAAQLDRFSLTDNVIVNAQATPLSTETELHAQTVAMETVTFAQTVLIVPSVTPISIY